MKKIWFYLSMIQSAVLLVIVVALCLSSIQPTVENADLVEYSEEEENNWVPDQGYIPDAQTALEVGSAVIDSMTGYHFFGASDVTYDAEHRLWRVRRGYLFRQGAFVVIEQDTGKIIKALLYK